MGSEHPSTLKTMQNLAWLYAIQGRTTEAEPLYIQTLEISTRVLGEDHPDTLRLMYDLADLYVNKGQYSEAECFSSRC